ncbi:hypothetical protein DY000_02048811 [Brassica cretica]|uniref:Chlorophyll a-b binding protein, chloroplastic n=1 Tax=Brassica cretica TaxID=69181 RepID=A0ABQ7F5P9_BRACR|nr:hypothetical protein DY000_02048811 [Brassica cretica]
MGFLFRSRACIWAQSSLGNPKYLFSPGPYSAFVGRTTTASGSCSGFGFLPPASSVLPPALVLGSSLEKYSGIEFLQIPGRTPASGFPLGDAPGPRWKVLRVRSQGPPPSSRKWKYSDKGILPYF